MWIPVGSFLIYIMQQCIASILSIFSRYYFPHVLITLHVLYTQQAAAELKRLLIRESKQANKTLFCCFSVMIFVYI